ncbi:hypothetical protein EJB05_29744, partial [Eragrostis curvula]
MEMLSVKGVQRIVIINSELPTDIGFRVDGLQSPLLISVSLAFVHVSGLTLGSFDYTSLTELNLVGCKYDADGLSAVISDCACLKQLLIGCSVEESIRVTSQSLVKIQIVMSTASSLIIDYAPKLQTLATGGLNCLTNVWKLRLGLAMTNPHERHGLVQVLRHIPYLRDLGIWYRIQESTGLTNKGSPATSVPCCFVQEPPPLFVLVRNPNWSRARSRVSRSDSKPSRRRTRIADGYINRRSIDRSRREGKGREEGMDAHELQASIRAGDYDRFVVHVGGRRLVVARPRYRRRRAPDSDDGLSNKRARVVPATDAAINRGLREVTLGGPDAKQTECAVCLKDFDAGDDKLRAMPCAHAFHEQCIVPWLRRNAVCPLCRSPFRPRTQENQEDPTASDMPAQEDTAA